MQALLDAAAVRRWCSDATTAMVRCQSEIDALNVFPIPDGDTGTNLASTLRCAADAVAADESTGAGSVLRIMARGALLGARGNSGVILSQVLRGLAEGFAGVDAGGSAHLVDGLQRATSAAYEAVAEPVEGTILSVLRAAAEAASAHDASGTDPQQRLSETVLAALTGADLALRRTTGQLDVLARAGVVDAGGRGLVVVLESLALVVTGVARAGAGHVAEAGRHEHSGASDERGHAAQADGGYEVQYLLQTDDVGAARVRAELGHIGTSIVVAGTGDGQFSVHVHTEDIGAAIELGLVAGRPEQVRVSRLADRTGPLETAGTRLGTRIVAIAPGAGLIELFRAEQVAVVEGGPADNPSTIEVLDAVLATDAVRVILLPNAGAVLAVAQLAAAEARSRGVEVAVIPTRSAVQGLAAVAVHDPARRFDDDVIAMAEAAAGTRFAEVTVAVRESITYAGRCQAGDVLGLIDGEVVEIGSDISAMGCSLVSRLIAAGGELVTVLAGSGDAAGAAADVVAAFVRSNHPLVEINRFLGGQPNFPLLIGVE
ncbi:MAG: dihydroxyacetone kinase family protein [Frankiales bacterium]|nr:dihydroxyacetone kinase family protein [Frankiales bacterium]